MYIYDSAHWQNMRLFLSEYPTFSFAQMWNPSLTWVYNVYRESNIR